MDESSARSIKGRNNSVVAVIAQQRKRQGFRRKRGKCQARGLREQREYILMVD